MKIIFLLSIMTIVTLSIEQAHSQAERENREIIINKLIECTKLIEDTAKLSCFNEVTRKSNQGAVHDSGYSTPPPHTVPTPSNISGNGASLKDTPQTTLKSNGEKIEEFGKESIQVRITKSNKIQSISSLIKSITYSSMRKFVIILENGQKWKQLDSDYRALLPGKKYEKVTIKRGALGSYNLIFDGSLPSYKAKRIE